MKIFIWLVVVAFGFLCLTCWVVAAWVLREHFGEALPAATALIVSRPSWLVLCPVPWFVYAVVLTRREELSVITALRFAGSVAVAASIVIYLVVVASLLPHIKIGEVIR